MEWHFPMHQKVNNFPARSQSRIAMSFHAIQITPKAPLPSPRSNPRSSPTFKLLVASMKRYNVGILLIYHTIPGGNLLVLGLKLRHRVIAALPEMLDELNLIGDLLVLLRQILGGTSRQHELMIDILKVIDHRTHLLVLAYNDGVAFVKVDEVSVQDCNSIHQRDRTSREVRDEIWLSFLRLFLLDPLERLLVKLL